MNGRHIYQRWSPRGRPWPQGRPRRHIFKSLALASKPQVLENCPVLGSRTALFFECLNFCRSAEKCFSTPFFFLRSMESFFKDIFSWENTCVCVLGLEHSCPWPRIFFVSLASNLAFSTPPLIPMDVLYVARIFDLEWRRFRSDVI